MKDEMLNKNLVLSVSSSIIILNGSDGGNTIRVRTAMLEKQLGAKHSLQAALRAMQLMR